MNILRISLVLASVLSLMPSLVEAESVSALKKISGHEHLQSRIDQKGRFELLTKTTRNIQSMGYTDQAVPEGMEMPDNMKHWMMQVDEASQFVDEHPEYSLGATMEGLPVIEPLLGGIRWNQSAPYNNLCPTNTPVGCVATAMAQVLYYYRYPEHGFGHKSYDQNGVHHSVDYENTYYKWDKMYDIYDRRYASAEGNAAVAELSYHCGVSVNMSYAPGGSGAYLETVPHALKKYFGYNSNAQVRNRGSYTYEDWVNLLVDELQAGRPIIFAANNQDVGHCFVLDGINKEGLFHVNWGWGGYYNGYFDVGILNPDGAGIGGSVTEIGYCLGQGAVVQLCPEEGTGEAICPVTYQVYGFWGDEYGVTLGLTFQNNSGDQFKTKIGIEIYNAEGEYCTDIAGDEFNFGAYPQRGFWQWTQFDIGYLDVPDGIYTYDIYGDMNGNRYYLLSGDVSDIHPELQVENHYIVNISDERSISQFSASNFNLADQETLAVGKAYTFTFDLKNEGEDTFVGDVALYFLPEGSDDMEKAEAYDILDVKLRPGQSKTLSYDVLWDKKENVDMGVAVLNYAYTNTRYIEIDGCKTLHFEHTSESPAALVAEAAAVLKTEHYEVGGEITFELNVANEGGKFSDKVAIAFFQNKAYANKALSLVEQDCTFEMTSAGNTVTISGTPSNLKGGTKYYARPFFKNSKGEYEQMMQHNGLPAITDVMVYKASGIETIHADETGEAPAYDLMGRRIKGQPKGLFIQGHATSVR